MTLRPGIESLREGHYELLAGKRVGLYSHPAAVDSQYVSTVRILTEAREVTLSALFAAEHGFSGAAREGQEVGHARDPRSGLPVYSLYGAAFRPTAEMLLGLDAIVCDIQDIGVRYYTYIWTLYEILQAAGEHGVNVIILDRPNPLGDRISGPLVEPQWFSLVGGAPVPVCHGMTPAELALMMNGLWNPTPCPLTIVKCEGWEGRPDAQTSGQRWVSPSPNMPQWVTARHYAGSCLIEGTNLSEGRGTALPFEIAGAPYIDGIVLADMLNRQDIPGVRWRPIRFQPSASKWAGEECGGVQAHITDTAAYDPLRTWLALIIQVRERYHDSFAWRTVQNGAYVFDRLIGSEKVRLRLKQPNALSAILAEWPAVAETFREQREPYLLYR